MSTRSRVHERILATNLLPPSSKICNCRVQICPKCFATIAVVGPTQPIISSGTHTRPCALPHAGHCPSSRMSLEQEKKRETADYFGMFQSVLAKICANLDTDTCNTSIRNQLQCKVLCNDYEHVKSIYRGIMVICHVSLVSSSVLQLQILLDGRSTK